MSCTSWQSSFKEVAGLTALYATGADGVRRMWRVAGGEVAAGEWARVNATEPGISFYIDAEGVSLEGVPAEQAGGGVGARGAPPGKARRAQRNAAKGLRSKVRRAGEGAGSAGRGGRG